MPVYSPPCSKRNEPAAGFDPASAGAKPKPVACARSCRPMWKDPEYLAINPDFLLVSVATLFGSSIPVPESGTAEAGRCCRKVRQKIGEREMLWTTSTIRGYAIE